MKLQISTNLKLAESIDVLSKKLGCFWDGKEYQGKVEGQKFWVWHPGSSFVKYQTPKFKGTLIEKGNGTLIEGYFTLNFMTFFETLSVIVSILFGLYFLGIALIVSKIKYLFFGSFMIIASLTYRTLVKRYRNNDMERIKNFLLTNLNATIKN